MYLSLWGKRSISGCRSQTGKGQGFPGQSRRLVRLSWRVLEERQVWFRVPLAEDKVVARRVDEFTLITLARSVLDGESRTVDTIDLPIAGPGKGTLLTCPLRVHRAVSLWMLVSVRHSPPHRRKVG